MYTHPQKYTIGWWVHVAMQHYTNKQTEISFGVTSGKEIHTTALNVIFTKREGCL